MTSPLLDERRTRRSPWTVILFLAAAVVSVGALDPEHRHVPLCPFHSTTGLQCPFCGSLRAVSSLAHGRVGAALHDNLLLVAVIPLLAWGWLDAAAQRRAGRPPRRWGRAGWIAGIAVLVVFAVVRNLPAAGWLRPT